MNLSLGTQELIHYASYIEE